MIDFIKRTLMGISILLFPLFVLLMIYWTVGKIIVNKMLKIEQSIK